MQDGRMGSCPPVGLNVCENAVVDVLTRDMRNSPGRGNPVTTGDAWVMNGDHSRSGICGIYWPLFQNTLEGSHLLPRRGSERADSV